jgi:hypothetical protein
MGKGSIETPRRVAAGCARSKCRKIQTRYSTIATERAKQGRQSGTHRRGRLQRVTAEGHEERFPPPKLNAGCGLRKETIPGRRRNGRDAPKAALGAAGLMHPGLTQTQLSTSLPFSRQGSVTRAPASLISASSAAKIPFDPVLPDPRCSRDQIRMDQEGK